MIYSTLLLDAHSFTVLSRITETPLLRAYQSTLHALTEDALSFASAYAVLCRMRFASDATAAFLSAIHTDENPLTQSLTAPDHATIQAATRDLQTIGALLRLDSTSLRREAAHLFEAQSLLTLPDFPPAEDLPFEDAAALASFYAAHGYGLFAEAHAFMLDKTGRCLPVTHADDTKLSDLIGYARERGQVLQNTLAFLAGKPANNALLYGDKGTGKSSTIKALVNEYADKGLKIISVTPQDFHALSGLFDTLAVAPFHFIVFLDDLSFQPEDENFSALKAFIEGGLLKAPKNVLMYATSNRRHLVAQRFSDREGNAVSVRDTLESSTSLSDRFGLQITFSAPDKESYLRIVEELCLKSGIEMDTKQLHLLAERFALRRNGRSPRTAHQFVHQLLANELA